MASSRKRVPEPGFGVENLPYGAFSTSDGRRHVGVAIGDRVEMTFRRFHTAGGVHNYFWKASVA